MAVYTLRPTSEDAIANMGTYGAATSYGAVDEAVYSETDYIVTTDTTALGSVRFGMGNLPATFSAIVINHVKVVFRLFWSTAIDPAAPTLWNRDWNIGVRMAATDYDSATTHARGDAATWPYTEEYTWTVNPNTGVRWTPTNVDALLIYYEETGKTGDQNGIPIAQCYAEIDYEPIPGEQDRMRDILTRGLASRRRGRRLLEVDAPLEFADLELGSLVRVAHDLGPEASGLGWPVTYPRIFRVLRTTLDLRNYTTRLLLEDLRSNVGLYRHLEIPHVTVTPGLGYQGVARAGLGGTRALTRATKAWVDDAGADAAGGHKVTEVPSGYEKVDADGLLIEAAATNYCGRSSFLDGATGWTTASGTGITAETTAAYQLFDETTVSYNPLTDQAIKHGKLIVSASTAQRVYIDSTTTLSGWHTVSVDHVPVTGDATQLRLQRTSDSFFWDGAAWVVGTETHSMGTTAGRYQIAVNCDDGVGGAITLRVHLRGSTTTDGDEWRFQHVQIEAGKYATSRIVTSGGTAGTRNADVLTIAQPSGKEVILGNGMTLIVWVQPEWTNTDLGADRVIFHTLWDADNQFMLRYEDSNDRWEAVLEAAGTTYTAYASGSVTKGTTYKVAVRMCSSSGEHSLSAYTLSIFVDGTKGTDANPAAAATEVADQALYIGCNSSSALQADASIKRFIVTPFVLSDAEVARFQ